MHPVIEFFHNIGLGINLSFGKEPSLQIQIGGNGKRLKPADSDESEPQHGQETQEQTR